MRTGGGDASVPPSRQTFGEKTSRERTLSGVLAVILSPAQDLCGRLARPCAEFTLSEANGLRVTSILSHASARGTDDNRSFEFFAVCLVVLRPVLAALQGDGTEEGSLCHAEALSFPHFQYGQEGDNNYQAGRFVFNQFGELDTRTDA